MTAPAARGKSPSFAFRPGLLEATSVAAPDRARRAVLRGFCALPVLRPILVEQQGRLLAMQLAALAVALLGALRFPLIALWLGAALFGVPHVVAGLRAVTITRRTSRVALAMAAAALGVGVAQLAGAGDDALRVFAVLFALAIAWEVLAARRGAVLTTATLGALGAATVAAVSTPRLAAVVLAHVHGLGALAFYAVAARRRGLPWRPLVIGAAAVAALAAFGALDGLMATRLFAPRGASGSIVAEAVGASGGGVSAALFHRALFLYAFGQSLHFAVWLRLVPDVDRATRVPKPFRVALGDFKADLGAWAWPLLALAGLSIPLMFVGGGIARESYFALTYFHVGLEAAALARLTLGRTAPAGARHTSPAPAPDRRATVERAAARERIGAAA